MLQTLGLKIGSAAHHPVGVSLMHRPVPEHVQHLTGQKHSTTTGPAKSPGRFRGLFGRKP